MLYHSRLCQRPNIFREFMSKYLDDKNPTEGGTDIIKNALKFAGRLEYSIYYISNARKHQNKTIIYIR